VKVYLVPGGDYGVDGVEVYATRELALAALDAADRERFARSHYRPENATETKLDWSGPGNPRLVYTFVEAPEGEYAKWPSRRYDGSSGPGAWVFEREVIES